MTDVKTETVSEILGIVQKHKKCSEASIYKWIKDLGIKPLGAPQRPRPYAAGTAQKILEHLGLVQPEPRIVSERRLRYLGKQAQKARAA